MARVKILYVVTLSEMGGAQKVVYHLAAGLDPGKFEVVVACAPGGELVRWLNKLHSVVQVLEIPELKRNISPKNDLLAFYKIFRLIRRERFDIVHCHSSKAGILGRLAAWLAGTRKIFFTVHGWGINEYQKYPTRFFYTSAERLAGLISTKVICVSKNDKLVGEKLRLVSSKKLDVIYNGLPMPRKCKKNLRKELGLGEGDIIIGMVARLAAPKEPLLFLEVADHLIRCSNTYPDVGQLYFIIIGDGPLKHACDKYICSKGLSRRVFLPGAKEDAAELMQSFDVFVLLSRWEGLPLTIIEAMLAGIPVVANAVGGIGELVVNEKTGFLIPELDVHEVKRVLWELVLDRNMCLSMGDAGKKMATGLFSLNEMLENYQKHYLS